MARKPRKRPAAPAPTSAVETSPALTVRHYCQGIGDCHLLTFHKPDGSPLRMLIDCGIHSSVAGGPDLIRDIVADVKTETGGRLDVLVVTHEHWDHVSGFLSAADLFKDFTVGEVWMAWTEDPKDPEAIAFDKFKGLVLEALQGASRRLDAERHAGPFVASLRDGLQAVLGFQFGVAGERVRAARDAAARLSSGQPPLYIGPETAPFSLADLPSMRVYVLGPPRSKEALRLEEKAGEMYALYRGASGPFLKALGAGLAASDTGTGGPADDARPFDLNIGTDLSAVLADGMESGVADFVHRNYSGPLPVGVGRRRTNEETASDQSWRRIDADWLGIAADLAMRLDRGVNNTSLVLAFEMLDTGRVFLFTGDAQVGNWLSWQDTTWPVGHDTVRATDLMARTVYLKVAHHGSQNATLERHGLDLMGSPDLSAFIPTSKNDALKVHWGEMPYHPIVEALAAKTGGRVVRADDEWLAIKDGKPGFACPSGSVLSARNAVRDPGHGKGGLWVEFDLG